MTTLLEPRELLQKTVAEIALAVPQAIEVFNRHHLDYCCGGKKPLAEACERAGLDLQQIIQEIETVQQGARVSNGIRFETLEPSLLIDFIVQHHHQYVREAIPQIVELLSRVVEAHGQDKPELSNVRALFIDLADELLHHLPKEEEILFPAIKQFLKASHAEGFAIRASVQAPVVVMEYEHEEAGNLVKAIRLLTNNYTVHEGACPTFRLTYTMLEEFDKDLMQHIHLENNVLFPMVKPDL